MTQTSQGMSFSRQIGRDCRKSITRTSQSNFYPPENSGMVRILFGSDHDLRHSFGKKMTSQLLLSRLGKVPKEYWFSFVPGYDACGHMRSDTSLKNFSLCLNPVRGYNGTILLVLFATKDIPLSSLSSISPLLILLSKECSSFSSSSVLKGQLGTVGNPALAEIRWLSRRFASKYERDSKISSVTDCQRYCG